MVDKNTGKQELLSLRQAGWDGTEVTGLFLVFFLSKTVYDHSGLLVCLPESNSSFSEVLGAALILEGPRIGPISQMFGSLQGLPPTSTQAPGTDVGQRRDLRNNLASKLRNSLLRVEKSGRTWLIRGEVEIANKQALPLGKV